MAGLVLVLGLSACGQAPPRGAAVNQVNQVNQVAPAAASTTCKDGKPDVASIDPGGITSAPGTWPASSRMAAIVKRQRLIVGTSGDAQLWGATDPQTGQLTGYDIDLAAQVARALGLGPDKITYKVLALSDRQAALNRPVDQGGVDLVAERMTITCARWEGASAASPAVNFSTPYYVAGQQRLLVRSDSTATGIGDLAGQLVCGVTGSSSLAGIQGSKVKIVTAPSAGQCLVMFQEGEAVAITGDDTTLAGLQTQDRTFATQDRPSSKVVGPQTANVPYGLGLPPGDAPFTQFVNSVLADLRPGTGEGSLTGLYNRWMKPSAGGSAPATQPVYGRNVAALKQKTS